jgi:hypothetical protein
MPNKAHINKKDGLQTTLAGDVRICWIEALSEDGIVAVPLALWTIALSITITGKLTINVTLHAAKTSPNNFVLMR